MYCELLNYQENIILYANPNVSKINLQNLKNQYFILHENDVEQTEQQNVTLISIKNKYWNTLVSHNNKIMTYNIIHNDEIDFNFLTNINQGNYVENITEKYKYLVKKLFHKAYEKYLSQTNTNTVHNCDMCEFFEKMDSIMNKIEFEHGYEEYFNMYMLDFIDDINTVKTEPYNLTNITDVIYQKKTFYDLNMNEICNKNLLEDYEISAFAQTTCDKKLIKREIKNDVLYLDYTYNHYNFGEFIDVLKRLLYLKSSDFKKYSISKLDVLSLKRTDVKDIDFYFNKFDFIENNHKILDWANVNQQLLLSNVFVNTTTKHIGRNHITKMTCFLMNKKFNPFQPDPNLKYRIFLSRDGVRRESVNKEYFYNQLSNRGFIFLNGSESLETLQKYFTNACVIVGEHGSLFQNIYFCKKSPFIIELSPIKFGSHMIFQQNSKNIGLTHLLFFLEAVNLEGEIEGKRGPLHIRYDDKIVYKLLSIIDSVVIK